MRLKKFLNDIQIGTYVTVCEPLISGTGYKDYYTCVNEGTVYVDTELGHRRIKCFYPRFYHYTQRETMIEIVIVLERED